MSETQKAGQSAELDGGVGLQPRVMRRGDLTLRTVDQHLMTRGELTTAEVVKWFDNGKGGEYCITLCYWRRGREGFDLHFVGRRPLVYASAETLWPLIEDGQLMLDDYFDASDA